MGQSRIVLETLLLRPTVRQSFEDKLNRNPGSPDCRLSQQPGVVGNYSFLPIIGLMANNLNLVVKSTADDYYLFLGNFVNKAVLIIDPS